jgi:hypothetical protein
MFTQYLDCTIEIQPRTGDSYPFSIHAPGGDARNTFQLPNNDQNFQASIAKLANLSAREDDLIGIGQKLFELLFQGRTKEILARSQGVLQPGQGLRIVLRGADDPDFATLPWEFLYDPDQGPLVMLDAPIVRYLPQSSVIPTLKTTLPLKVLLTSAQPKGLAPINVASEIGEIQSALAELEQHGLVQLVVEPHLTRSAFQRLLRQGFHIWHFAGHGGFKPDGTTSVLYFEDAEGDAEWSSAMELGILLNRSGIRLIVLDACESGRLATEPFRTLAPSLIRAQIPAVIAMQFKFPDHAASAFAGELYRALAEGFPIDACVTEGRKAVMAAVGLGRPDWGIPVVYTRAPDGKLFDLPEQATQSTPSAIKVQPAPPTTDVDEQAEELAALQEQLRQMQRRLWNLENQAARYGFRTPPDIATEITDLNGLRDKDGKLLLDRYGKVIREGEIEVLKRKIAELQG